MSDTKVIAATDWAEMWFETAVRLENELAAEKAQEE